METAYLTSVHQIKFLSVFDLYYRYWWK